MGDGAEGAPLTGEGARRRTGRKKREGDERVTPCHCRPSAPPPWLPQLAGAPARSHLGCLSHRRPRDTWAVARQSPSPCNASEAGAPRSSKTWSRSVVEGLSTERDHSADRTPAMTTGSRVGGAASAFCRRNGRGGRGGRSRMAGRPCKGKRGGEGAGGRGWCHERCFGRERARQRTNTVQIRVQAAELSLRGREGDGRAPKAEGEHIQQGGREEAGLRLPSLPARSLWI